MSDEIKLLPCPFCGADAYNMDDYPDDIICKTPHCIVNHVVTFGFESREQLSERWNRRSQSGQKDLIAACEMLIESCKSLDDERGYSIDWLKYEAAIDSAKSAIAKAKGENG